MSDSSGLVDFAIGLVNSVINLPDRQVKVFEEFKLQKNCEINLLIKTFLGLAEMMFGLVNVSFSLPKWQAVKMTFFAPCIMFFFQKSEILMHKLVQHTVQPPLDCITDHLSTAPKSQSVPIKPLQLGITFK